ncbi:MAG TPA: accessory Sec system translocase SecA2 [Blastocatellia bacterium]|jgi:preprotein translocase subunit SecA|nr:accessory Sec system translocase SecA2 [Blastocatellia bacterium]
MINPVNPVYFFFLYTNVLRAIAMKNQRWMRRLDKLRGVERVEEDLGPYEEALYEINRRGEDFARKTDDQLREVAILLRERARHDASSDELLIEVFALAREAADRSLGLRPFDVQVMAGVALGRGRLVEMQTGEGKTLAAVAPACLNALTGRGVHVLTFNDYLARRDAAWMGPVYRFLGLSVGAIQEGMSASARREAYAADVTYATAKEAGFDFLRGGLCRTPDELVHRPFNFAIIDEADSILIDEARVPLVIAGERPGSQTSLYRIAELIAALARGEDWETDENDRNVSLTERGVDRVEAELGCGDLYAAENYLLLVEINQALHARALLLRDVDYIVRDGGIELVDEFTGRVMDDRRWPDELQAALEAKEGLQIRPGGRILGSITLQHFLKHYPRLSGMTATAQPAAEELEAFYGLKVVPIPPNRPCIREDLPDVIFTHKDAKRRALIAEIRRANATGRPVLVGTSSVEESETLARKLSEAGVACRALNAKNDEAEAEIVAEAGAIGAVTISTNMAGRGTDIRLGGAREEGRERVVALGGLYVIGTNRHESRRIDDQLRGRAGRQGDPGTSRFFVSLEDDLMARFGIDHLIPPKIRPAPQDEPIEHSAVRHEVERLQRIVEGQNYEIRKTLWRYSSLVEEQRRALQDWRMSVLTGEAELGLCAERFPKRYAELRDSFGEEVPREAERAITLGHIDVVWAEHLALIAEIREGIHLVSLGRQDPLYEFTKLVAEAFVKLHQTIEERIVSTFATAKITENGIDLDQAGLRGPSSTWTYLINDQAMSDLQRMLYGFGGAAFAIGAVLTTWPLLIAWGIWRRFTKRKR